MPGYVLEGPKAARMYEVILPKKLGYFGKVQEVLEDLFDEEAIRDVPSVREAIAEPIGAGIRSSTRRAGSRRSARRRGGYSIYEMDGRYLSPAGPVDERVLVIRFIFHNPRVAGRPEDRLPGRVARGGQPPGRPPVRRGAGGRGGDLVPGVHRTRSWPSGGRTTTRPTP